MPSVPLFPLRAVMFPGSASRLHIFEDRYRALMRDLIATKDPSQRTFGIVAIRAGSEVGPEVPQLFPIGTLVQLIDFTRDPSGTYDIEIIGRERFRLQTLHVGSEYLRGDVEILDDEADEPDATLPARALAAYERYRELLEPYGVVPSLPDTVPSDPGYLAYVIAGSAALSRLAQQGILASNRPTERLRVVTQTLADEIRAIRAIPSLPAIEAAPPRWPVN